MDYQFLYDLGVSINKYIYKEENLCSNVKVILEYISETAYMHNIKNEFHGELKENEFVRKLLQNDTRYRKQDVKDSKISTT